MKIPEIKKGQASNLGDIIEYVPHSVVNRDIIKKTTGSISVIAIDTGEEFARKTSPFDIFIEIIEGAAEIVIEDKSIHLETGQAIIIPAHAPNNITAGERCKMLVTIIKSGYEQEL
ncbi:MAG: cupin domain-containing protein [Bacteroidia bacterium]|nr:cupin domain-containing protein [Bacteroidia bacterium]